MNIATTTGAARKRRYRERQRRNAMVVRVEIDDDALKGLRESGALDAVEATDPGDTSDRARVGEAIELLLRALASGEHVVILAEDA